jgi:hypothetical protein
MYAKEVALQSFLVRGEVINWTITW